MSNNQDARILEECKQRIHWLASGSAGGPSVGGEPATRAPGGWFKLHSISDLRGGDLPAGRAQAEGGPT